MGTLAKIFFTVAALTLCYMQLWIFMEIVIRWDVAWGKFFDTMPTPLVYGLVAGYITSIVVISTQFFNSDSLLTWVCNSGLIVYTALLYYELGVGETGRWTNTIGGVGGIVFAGVTTAIFLKYHRYYDALEDTGSGL